MGPIIIDRKNFTKEILWEQLRDKSIKIEFITETIINDLRTNKKVSTEYEVNLAFLEIKNKYSVNEYHDESGTHITIISDISDRSEMGKNSQNKLDQELINILEINNSLKIPIAKNKVVKRREINWGCLAFLTGISSFVIFILVCSIIGFVNFLRLLYSH